MIVNLAWRIRPDELSILILAFRTFFKIWYYMQNRSQWLVDTSRYPDYFFTNQKKKSDVRNLTTCVYFQVMIGYPEKVRLLWCAKWTLSCQFCSLKEQLFMRYSISPDSLHCLNSNEGNCFVSFSLLRIPSIKREDQASGIGHFRVHLSLHFKARLSEKSLLWKSVFIHIETGTNYHNKHFALRLALKERLRGTRKWPIISSVVVVVFFLYLFCFVCPSSLLTGERPCIYP